VQIAELRIKGFRGIHYAKLKLAKYNILIGPNNCGKSTVIEALALLFGRDRLVRDLTEHDFFGSAPLPPTEFRSWQRLPIFWQTIPTEILTGFETAGPYRNEARPKPQSTQT
jgi:predicted ATP-dependent endonuclease of OLD family